jgi:hypothetical protein
MMMSGVLSQIRFRFRGVLAGALCAAAVVMVLSAGGAQGVQWPQGARGARGGETLAAARSAAYLSTVSVDVSGKAIGRLDAQYIGLSFESSTLDSPVNRYDNVGNLPRLMKNLGSGVMRFGGDSVDLSSFTGTAPSVLRGVARLAAATGWPVLYTENLAEFNGPRVTADARSVAAALGSRLLALACGNEPDQWVAIGVRPPGYTVGDYLTQSGQCLSAIRAGASGAPLEGPDATNYPALASQFAAKEAGKLAWFGQHYYPMGCAQPGDDPAALATTLLSPALAKQEAARFAVYAASARLARASLLITETNNACHGGITGLSNSYAAALWVIDYLLTGAEHGVTGMNLQTGLNANCTGYTVFCAVAPFSYRPQPVYYGMLLAHMLGGGDLVPVKVTSPAPAGSLVAFALRHPGGGVRLLLENMSGTSAAITLHVGGFRGEGTVLRLTAPSLLATSGVRIQGAAVAGNGFLKPGKPGTAWCKAAGCAVNMSAHSAVLIKFP